MKALLYVLLGISLGAGCTLIALQERFLRERRRLLALGEAHRAPKGEVAEEEADRKWQAECELLEKELDDCRLRLAEAVQQAAAAAEPIAAEPGPEFMERSEHERLIQEKNGELSRLAADHKTLLANLDRQQQEISDLHGQLAYLKDELAKAQEAALAAAAAAKQPPPPDDDFLLLGGKLADHLLPGSVARAFIKGNPKYPR